MATTPLLALRSPRPCRRIEIDPELFHPRPLRRLHRLIRRVGGAVTATLRGANALRRRRALIRARRRERPEALLRHRVQLALCLARSDDECRRFSVGRVLALAPLEGGVFEARAALISKRSGGHVERVFLVRIDRALWRRLLGQAPRVVVLGREVTDRLAPLGRLAAGRRLSAGRQTLRPLPSRARPGKTTRRGFDTP